MIVPGTAASPSHNALTPRQPSLPAEWHPDGAHDRREIERIRGGEWIRVGHVSSPAAERS